jgi:imidazolonepropionase-like amidohydrolase
MAIVGGTCHVGDGTVVNNCAVTFENGRITFIGDLSNVRIDASRYEIIEATEKHVYPAFHALASNLGLKEISRVRATRDYDEVGEYTPHVRSLIAYNTDSRVTPTVRSNGVLYAQITPVGATISGTSSIVQLDAWNWEDAAVSTDNVVHVNWNRIFSRTGWWSENEAAQARERYETEVSELYDFFEQARAYSHTEQPQPINLRFEAMRGVFDGSKKVFIHAYYDKEIIAAITFARHFSLDAVLVGARDAWLLTDLIAESGYPVVLLKTHKLPSSSDEAIDLPYRTPALLADAGIDFALSLGIGRHDFYNLRNLPFQAGNAVAFGLDYEKAVEAITLAPARIAGLDAELGSLAVGKQASMIISEGDALDMRSHKIVEAFIDGRRIDLDNKQKQLYRKFADKYGLETE